jgi:hypothetical protein
MNKRLITLAISIAIAAALVWGVAQINWSPSLAYLAFAALAFFFLGMLVSSQQYEEDAFSKIERFVSASLLSYIVFFRFFYAPLSQYFFGTLITKASFMADLLSLILFAIFFFLFGTAFLVVNSYARTVFLPQWIIFNNEKAFFILRGLFLSAVVIFALFYLRNSFFSVKNSSFINKVLPSSTCSLAYTKYPDFISTGRTVSGKNVCLYNYSKDKYDPKACDFITDSEARSLCNEYFIPESEE